MEERLKKILEKYYYVKWKSVDECVETISSEIMEELSKSMVKRKMKLKIGDRVEVIGSCFGFSSNVKGERGRIIGIDYNLLEPIEVEFDRRIEYAIKSGGLGKEGYCQSGYPDELKVIKEVENEKT